VLHETIHELRRKKIDGILVKIDSETTYNKLKWLFFLQQTLCMNSPKWSELIYQFLQGGSVDIKVNNDIGHYI
jgi:hypothetical protein